MQKLTILIASNNEHKQKEILQIFLQNNITNIEIVKPKEVLSDFIDVIEDGDTLEKNAVKKAKEFHHASQLPSIADDTGLEIDYLNGEPGVLSARYAGEHGNDAMNRKKVLEMLSGVALEKRTARFRTVIAFDDGKTQEIVEGKIEGKIIFEEKGTNGFGYDSIFMPDTCNKTFAEMSDEEKNRISHRANATKNLTYFLKHYYGL